MLHPRFSQHAREALARMPDVTEGDVFHCINDSENAWYGSAQSDRPRWTYQRGHIAVVTDETTSIIITVLYRDHQRWERASREELEKR